MIRKRKANGKTKYRQRKTEQEYREDSKEIERDKVNSKVRRMLKAKRRIRKEKEDNNEEEQKGKKQEEEMRVEEKRRIGMAVTGKRKGGWKGDHSILNRF